MRLETGRLRLPPFRFRGSHSPTAQFPHPVRVPRQQPPGPAPGLTPVVVESRFGGQIFGFDIDPDGTEGILSEAQTQDDGSVLAAVETFDQRTGAILALVARRTTHDDFVTLGVVGRHVGLVEYEHEVAFLDMPVFVG